MRTRQRLKGLQEWIYEELCAGRSMKAPGENWDYTKIVRQEPKCFLGWMPSRPDTTGWAAQEDPASVCPGIIIMPNLSKLRAMEEKRFDRYNKVSRPKELGQTLSVSILFSIYEPGTRLPGYIDTQEMSLIREGTEEGLFTLTDWMDELGEKLLSTQLIPGTDLYPNEETAAYSLYTDQSFVVDKRPIYCGFMNAEFNCYADERPNNAIEQLLM